VRFTLSSKCADLTTHFHCARSVERLTKVLRYCPFVGSCSPCSIPPQYNHGTPAPGGPGPTLSLTIPISARNRGPSPSWSSPQPDEIKLTIGGAAASSQRQPGHRWLADYRHPPNYVLTVVLIVAGVAAITSLAPDLLPMTLWMESARCCSSCWRTQVCESGSIFAIHRPIYSLKYQMHP